MRVIDDKTWCLIGLVVPALGCAAPCVDDGLLQESCPSELTANADDGDAGSGNDDGQQDTDAQDGGDGDGDGSDSASDTDGDGGTGSTDGDDDADGGSSGEPVDPGGPWCLDSDGDGFGDPTQCSDEPGPGTVENDGDCNDDDPNTHPGAAELEPDPTACTTDTDGDGWGDAKPWPGAVAGSDCWPEQPALSPSTVLPGSVDNGPLEDVAATLDELSATLSVVAPIDTPLYGWNVTGTAMRDDGSVFVVETLSGTIRRLDYGPVCNGTNDEGSSTALAAEIDVASICGLSFDDEDHMWAIDAAQDTLLKINPVTGAVLQQVGLSSGGAPLDLADCGLAWDCHTGRLLLAHASAGQLREVDRTTGETTVIATYDPDLGVAAVVYEPIERVALVSSGLQLNRVPLDGSLATEVGTFNYDGATATDVANMGPIPLCP